MREFFKPKVGITRVLIAAGTLACLSSVMGFWGGYWWLFDLASHFRVQYLLILALIGLALLPARRYRVTVAFSLFAVANLVLVLPLYLGERTIPDDLVSRFRAMHVNVQRSNTQYVPLLNTVKRYNPDFLLMEEVDTIWMSETSQLAIAYPYSLKRVREDNFGIVLFSKVPFVNADIVFLGEVNVPSVLARFELDGEALAILGTHTFPPVSSDYARLRNTQLAAIPDLLAELDTPVLVLGDLNASPWSYPFRRLLRNSGLRDAALGNGFQPTWPTSLFPLLIPIDHCLYSPGIRIVNLTVGNDVGSDHYPVIVDFTVSQS